MKTITIRVSELPFNITIVPDEPTKSDEDKVAELVKWATTESKFSAYEMRWIHAKNRVKLASDLRKQFTEHATIAGFDVPTIAAYLQKDIDTVRYYLTGNRRAKT
jgi:hypothetical protein